MPRSLMRSVLRTLVSLIAACALASCGGQSAQVNGEAITHTIETRFKEQDGRITVHLPDSYQEDTAQDYPVLYIPAGRNLNSKTIRRTIDAMTETRKGPEIIVVTSNAYYRALPPSDIAESNGAAPDYLTHLEAELIPFIEDEYRTSSIRWISGFSSTGIFLLYAMAEAPDLFTGYMFQSPAFDDDWIDYSLATLSRRFELIKADPIKVFMGIGDRDTRNDRQDGFAAVTSLLEEAAPQNIFWKTEYYSGKRHEEFPDLIRDAIQHLSTKNERQD